MALATQDDVRRPEFANPGGGNDMERLYQDFQAGAHPAQRRAQFPRAGPLTVDCVVDKINEQFLFQTVKLPVESANINAAIHHCRSSIDVITNLEFADALTIVRR